MSDAIHVGVGYRVRKVAVYVLGAVVVVVGIDETVADLPVDGVVAVRVDGIVEMILEVFDLVESYSFVELHKDAAVDMAGHVADVAHAVAHFVRTVVVAHFARIVCATRVPRVVGYCHVDAVEDNPAAASVADSLLSCARHVHSLRLVNRVPGWT